MQKKSLIPFKIETLDPLGQGVSKISDQVTFVAKTLPGEEGEADLVRKRKQVGFANLIKVTKPSAIREKSACPHFWQCSGCHYLHTSYENEIQFKKETIQKIFREWPGFPLEIHPAPRRFDYRNRVQLHYDLKSGKLGFHRSQSSQVIEVPSCLLPLGPIRESLKLLYENQSWMKVAKGFKEPQGHVELYLKGNEVIQSWNKSYAEGGFTQVFSEMNEELKNWITKQFSNQDYKILDLFGGNGNISTPLRFLERLVVDYDSTEPSQGFLSQNLFDEKAVSHVQEKINFEPNLLIFDPPRSGVKNLEEWTQAFPAQTILYVSCDPHTLARDLKSLGQKYKLDKLSLFDFFPGTFHFETVAILSRAY